VFGSKKSFKKSETALFKKMTYPKVKLSDKEVEEKIEEFREWIRNEPKLPQNLGTRKFLQ
jgi:hypothetical protein